MTKSAFFRHQTRRAPRRSALYRPRLTRLEDRTAPAGLSLAYSTLLSGTSSSAIRGMTTDNAGDLYVTGITTGPGFPTTPGAYQTSFRGGFDSAFVVKRNPQGQILWSTLFGAPGAGGPYAYAVTLDSQGDVYISGRGKNITATFSAPGGWGAAANLIVTIANPATGLSVTLWSVLP